MIKKFLKFSCLILPIALAFTLSCKNKSEDPTPTTNNNSNSSGTGGTDTTSGFCGDTICKFPFKVTPTFIPSGFYNTGDMTTALDLDSIGEPVSYTGEGLRIQYTYSGNYWGASFINNNSWDTLFHINNTATKITCKVKFDYSLNLTLNAFGDSQYGKIELYKKANPVTPVWQDITIPLSSVPTHAINGPLNVILDGFTGAQGTVITVYFKDILIE